MTFRALRLATSLSLFPRRSNSDGPVYFPPFFLERCIHTVFIPVFPTFVGFSASKKVPFPLGREMVLIAYIVPALKEIFDGETRKTHSNEAGFKIGTTDAIYKQLTLIRGLSSSISGAVTISMRFSGLSIENFFSVRFISKRPVQFAIRICERL